jgi:hypothetical protein
MVGERIGVDPEVIQRALADEAHTSENRGGASGVERGRLPGHVKVEREALRLLLLDGETTARWVGDVQESDFTSGARRELFRAARTSEGFSSARIAEGLSPDALALFSELTVGADAGSEAETPPAELFARLRVFGLERDIKARRDTIEKVNPLEEPERHDALFTELVELQARRRDLLKGLQGEQ